MNKIELLGLAITAISVSLLDAMATKIILSVIGAITFVTASKIYGKWLDKRLKDREYKDCFKKKKDEINKEL